MAGEMMLIDARLMPATAVIVRVIGRFIVFSFDERVKKRVARKPMESTQRFNGARSVASTDGAARTCQVLRLACFCRITVAGQRRNLTGLPLNFKYVDEVVDHILGCLLCSIDT